MRTARTPTARSRWGRYVILGVSALLLGVLVHDLWFDARTRPPLMLGVTIAIIGAVAGVLVGGAVLLSRGFRDRT